MLIVISILLGIAIGLGAFIGRQILGRLDRLNKTDNEQWEVIRKHERELGAHDAILKLHPHPVSGGE